MHAVLGVGIGGLHCSVDQATPTRVTARCNASAWRGELRGLPWLTSGSGHGVGCTQLVLNSSGVADSVTDSVGGAPSEIVQTAVSDPAIRLEAAARRARSGVDAVFGAWVKMTRTDGDVSEVLSLVPLAVFQLDVFNSREADVWSVFGAARRVGAAMVATEQAAPTTQALKVCDWAVTVGWTASEAIALLPELRYITNLSSVISTHLSGMHATIRRLFARLESLPQRVRAVRSLFNRTASMVGSLDVSVMQKAAAELEPASRIDAIALQNASQTLLDFIEQGVLTLAADTATNSTPTVDVRLVVGALKKWLLDEETQDSGAMMTLKGLTLVAKMIVPFLGGEGSISALQACCRTPP